MLTLTELKLETNETYKDLTLQDWKDKSDFRGITRRSQYDFDNLIPMYIKKIGNIREQLRGVWSVTLTPIVSDKLKTVEELGSEIMEEIQYLLDKETRLIDKFVVCRKEVQMRKDGDVIRIRLHDQANYYIDYVNGSDARTGLNPDTTGDGSWKTITKYTTTTVRTAGDVAYLRANTTWLQGTEAVSINFDEDGTQDNYIKIIGCDSVTNDPWTDSSDVLPIVDFENANYQWLINTDNFWKITRIDSRQSVHASGMFRFASSYGCVISACVFRDLSATGQEGIYTTNADFTVEDSSFINCFGTSILISGGACFLDNCTFNGGADVSTDYGIRIYFGVCRAKDCSFGQTTSFDVADIRAEIAGEIYLRNCLYDKTPTTLGDGVIYSEDDDGIFESHVTYQSSGTVARDTGTVRGGGADSSAKLEPSSICGANNPLILGWPLKGFAQVWVAAGSYTVSVYARVGSLWDSALTAAECYIKTSELDNAGDATRVERQSTQQILNDTNWQAFTTSISPARDGFVYIWLYLEEYEDATEHIFVDIKPTVA